MGDDVGLRRQKKLLRRLFRQAESDGCTHVAVLGDVFHSPHPTQEELVAAIGPSICVDCYEVSEEVAEQFREGFPEDVLQPGKAPGKYQLDLWKANQSILLRAGIQPEHMAVTNVCTCHNPEYLFSHRASHGQRGNLAAFLMLKES
jgi:copper oxidase (laccase) domain-containing protein